MKKLWFGFLLIFMNVNNLYAKNVCSDMECTKKYNKQNARIALCKEELDPETFSVHNFFTCSGKSWEYGSDDITDYVLPCDNNIKPSGWIEIGALHTSNRFLLLINPNVDIHGTINTDMWDFYIDFGTINLGKKERISKNVACLVCPTGYVAHRENGTDKYRCRLEEHNKICDELRSMFAPTSHSYDVFERKYVHTGLEELKDGIVVGAQELYDQTMVIAGRLDSIQSTIVHLCDGTDDTYAVQNIEKQIKDDLKEIDEWLVTANKKAERLLNGEQEVEDTDAPEIFDATTVTDDEARLKAKEAEEVQQAKQKLESFFSSVASGKKDVWKDKDGNFNTKRLASDLTAGVVLGTVGGVVSGVVIKKKQIEKGFDALHCTVGGQTVADWGDTFTVGLGK